VETENIIGPEQTGFRKNRSKSDHLIKIDHDIKKGSKEKKSTGHQQSIGYRLDARPPHPS